MRKKILGILAAIMLIIPTLQAAAAEAQAPEGMENLDYTFESIDGETISTHSSGKPKILVFFKTGCLNCQATLRDIASNEWFLDGDAEVCAIETNKLEVAASTDDVKSFQNEYCQESSIMFASTKDKPLLNDSIWAYSTRLGFGYSLTTPLVVMIDPDDKILGGTTGYITAAEIKNTYSRFLNSDSDETQNPDDTQEPDDTQNPNDTQEPDDTQNPDDTQEPDDTQNPDDTQEPNDTQNPDDTQKPDGTQNPDDTQKPDGTQNPDDTQKPNGTQNPDNTQNSASANKPNNASKPDNSSKSENSQNAANAAEEAERLYKNSPSVKYAEYLKKMADALKSTKQSEFVINTNVWTCFNRTMLDAIKSRPDVTVTVHYIYEGKPYVLIIPAGTDVSQFMDANGFAGFRYIDKMLNTKK